MGMEVAGSEIVHGNGEVRVESFSNPHEKENRKLHNLGKGVTEPGKLGSHGADETAKANGDIVSNANFPKVAADEWPAEQKMHSFYFVRYRAFDKPNLKAKIDQADKEIWKRNHQRVQILDRIKAKRLDQAQTIEQLRSLGQEHWQYRTVVDEKLNQMKPLKDARRSLRDSNNAGSDKIHRFNHGMQHEVISLSEEKQLVREIKQLEGTRDKVIANAAMRAEIQGSMGHKEAILDQVTLIGTEQDGVKEHEVAKSRIKQLEDELKLIDGDIGSLQLGLTCILEKRDKAVEMIYELRRQRDGKNACFFQNRTLLSNAKDLAAEKNIEALKELSCAEVEKFMASWNSSKSLRDDYEKRISASLDIRQLSRDGRIRNPDEKPLFLVQQTNKKAEAQALAKATPNPAKQDPEPVKEQENIPAEKESKRKQEELKTAVKLNNVEDDEEEYYIVELPKKENEIDEATLKEIKKQEEMEKQKQAMERKKKLAEKAAAKAALRAQKEAEKKQKEREKRMKKKESFSAAEAEIEKLEKVEENVKTPVAGKTKDTKDVSATVSVRYRGRTKGCDSIPKAILRRKRSNTYLLWVAAAAVMVGVVLALIFN